MLPRLCLIVILVLSACSSGADDASDDGGSPASSGSTTTSEPAEAVASELVEEPCWWELEDSEGTEVTCGTVAVPSDPADPGSDPVQLAVARLSGTDEPADDPILYLHGGPGGDALGQAPEGLAALDALAVRDVIAFDQRGSGRSTPSLDCPEKEEAIIDTLGSTDPFDAELEVNRAAVRACFDRLTEEEGIDLDHYDTPANVADIEVLRETFGVEAWNVWGGSYGTRLALDYARTHPERVRTLVLDSVYPPEVGGVDRARTLPGAALDRLVEACAEDGACASAYGDLAEVLAEAQVAMDDDPEELTAPVTVAGEERERDFRITGTDLRAGLFAALYDSELVPLLPSVVAAVAAGDRSIVPQFLELGVPRLIGLSEGAFYSVECADSGRALDGADVEAELATVADDALVALNSAQVFCADWPVERSPASWAEPVTVDVPTVVFGGTLDPITPFTDSEAQAEAMPDARFVAVPRGGHGVGGFDECTRSARDALWEDPAAGLPACVEEIEPLPFVVGG